MLTEIEVKDFDLSDKEKITVGDYLALLDSGRIIPYPKNRGRLPLNSHTIDKIVNDFWGPGIGTCTMTKMDDGRHMTIDFHTRTAGLLKRRELGFMTAEDNAVEIPIKIVQNEIAIKTYQVLNTATGHNTAQKLNNDDLPFGKVIETILSPLADLERPLKGKMPQLANVAFCYKNPEIEEFNYKSVFGTRQKVGKIIDSLDDVHLKHLTPKYCKDLTNAIKYYSEFLVELTALNPDKDDTYKSITKSTPFFGLLLTDFLNSDILTSVEPHVLARNVNKRKGNIVNYIVGLTHGGNAMIASAIGNIYMTIMKRRTGGRRRSE